MSDLLDVFDDMPSESEREGRIAGPLRGVVTNNSDPDGLCRVKARVGAQGDRDETTWLSPLLPGGIEAIPEVKEPVLVFYIDGDPTQGCYAWAPSSKTTGRPTDAMILGTTFVAMYNDLAGKFNTLKSKYNQLQVDVALLFAKLAPANFLYQVGAATLAGLVQTASQDTDGDAGKGKNANAGIVSSASGDKVVLSKRAKVK